MVGSVSGRMLKKLIGFRSGVCVGNPTITDQPKLLLPEPLSPPNSSPHSHGKCNIRLKLTSPPTLDWPAHLLVLVQFGSYELTDWFGVDSRLWGDFPRISVDSRSTEVLHRALTRGIWLNLGRSRAFLQCLISNETSTHSKAFRQSRFILLF